MKEGLTITNNVLDVNNGQIKNIGSLYIPSSGITMGGNQLNMANGNIENVGMFEDGRRVYDDKW